MAGGGPAGEAGERAGALVAAGQAIADAGIDFQKDDLSEETATIVASGIGGYTTMDKAYVRLYKDNIPRARPSTIPRLMISAAASQRKAIHRSGAIGRWRRAIAVQTMKGSNWAPVPASRAAILAAG